MNNEKRIVVIGGTGTMATAVVQEMVAHGFSTTALIRDLDKAKQLLPAEVKFVVGDLNNRTVLREAVQNATHVYFHAPATVDRMASFIAERDGLANILEVLSSNTILLKLSEIGAFESPDFYDLWLKYQSEQKIKQSKQPFVIFRPTWFMEALPLQLTQNKTVSVFGEQPNPVWFIATKDYARMVCRAIEQETATLGQTFTVQGAEPMTMEAAARMMIEIAKPDHEFTRVPLTTLEQWAKSTAQWQFVLELMRHYDNRQEIFESEQTWRVLGAPEMTMEKFMSALVS